MMWWQLAWALEPGVIDGVQQDRDFRPDGLEHTEIVGGRAVERDEYADAVGIVFRSQYVGCTGTLVAPNVVITAGHCLDDLVTHVVVGGVNWFEQDIEALAVEDYWTHPSYNNAYDGSDIGVIKLAESSSFKHRVIANDCVLDEVVDGTPATIVGYGNTNVDGSGSTSTKHVAETLVEDADCSDQMINGVFSGCQEQLQPGGEIVAGGRLDVDGDGVRDGARDVCFGDSGGPLYVHTRFGTHVMGVTSRAMLGVESGFPCRDGSIWTRPDSVMEWLENRTGVTLERPQCNVPPEVQVEPVDVQQGNTVRFKPKVTDPDSSNYNLELVQDGVLGSVSIRGKRIVYRADKDALGPDVITVRFTDDGADDGGAPASIEVDFTIAVVEGGCGCQTQSPNGVLWLPLLGLFLRRRSRA